MKPILEVHILDFNRHVYGKCVKVIFRRKLRPEIKFKGLEELKAAIAEDILEAKAYFRERAA